MAVVSSPYELPLISQEGVNKRQDLRATIGQGHHEAIECFRDK
jgi:hypothetical protein